MKVKDVIKLTLTTGIFLCTFQLSAWQRQAMQDCELKKDNCFRRAGKCDREYERCQQEAPQQDMESFAAALSPTKRQQFQFLSQDQKFQAMDLADNNQMPPRRGSRESYL